MQPFEKSENVSSFPARNSPNSVETPFAEQVAPFVATIAPNTQEPLASPHDVLVQLTRNKEQMLPANRKKLFLYIAGALLAMQILMPAPLKPSGIAAGIVGSFWLAVGGTTSHTEQLRRLESSLADLKNRKLEAEGNCTYADLIGQGQLCRGLVAQRFEGQIRALESEIDAMKPKGVFETLFGK